MRRSRVNLPDRCYHQIRRVAHRAFFLDDGERTRLVDLVRRDHHGTTLDIASREYFTKAYLRPLTEAGLIVRTVPDHRRLRPLLFWCLELEGR